MLGTTFETHQLKLIRSDLAQAITVPEPITGRPLARLASWYTVTLLIAGVWLYGPVLIRLTRQWWSDPNFSHGFFVPIFSAFVVWQNRSRLRAVQPKPSIWGLPVIVISLAMLLIGTFGVELFLSRM